MPPSPSSLLPLPYIAVTDGTKRWWNETPFKMIPRGQQFTRPHVLFPGEHVGNGSKDHDNDHHLRQDTATKTQLSWAGEIVCCCIDLSCFTAMCPMMFCGPVCCCTSTYDIEALNTEEAKQLMATADDLGSTFEHTFDFS